MNSTISNIRKKDKDREECDRLTREYLAKGKKITNCEPCISTEYKHGHVYLRSVKAT